jgi:hypothetical protein
MMSKHDQTWRELNRAKVGKTPILFELFLFTILLITAVLFCFI